MLVLDAAMALLLGELPGMTLAGFAAVKFTAIIRPEQDVEVRCGEPGDGRIGFECVSGGALAVRGTALLRSVV